MKTYTGREIEKMFGIPQQYRSRYDKAYADFISPSDVTPRTYTESDVTVYQAIKDGHAQGRTRTAIAVLLVEMVSRGTVTFHGTDIKKYLEVRQPATSAVNGNGQEPAKKVTMPRREHKPASLANLDVIVELSTRVGELAARNTFLEERIGDMEHEIDTLKRACAELRENKKRGLFR